MQVEVQSADWGIRCVRCAASLAAAGAMAITKIAELIAEFVIYISAQAAPLMHGQSPRLVLHDKFSTVA
jgi:uncharacterized paraquat-inducible protein A